MKLKYIFKRLIGGFTHCYNYGRNNKVVFIKNGKEYKRLFMPKGLTIYLEGNNTIVNIHCPIKFKNTLICCEDGDNEFSIGSSQYPIRDAKFYMEYNSKILIGNGHQFKSRGLEITANCAYKTPSVVKLGDNVFVGKDVIIRSSDGHTLINAETKEPINETKNINIENNVWIGARSIILKGSNISKGSVVGAGSLVNKDFSEENVLIAGSPAQVIKQNVTWDKRGYGNYKRNYYDKQFEK